MTAVINRLGFHPRFRGGEPQSHETHVSHCLPSGKRLHNYGKSPFLMDKSIINHHFQYVAMLVYQRVTLFN